MTTAISIPERNEKALTAVDQAKALAIKTNEDFTEADRFCVNLKALEKEVDAAYDEHISDAFAAHRSLVAKKKKYAEPIDEARRIVKGKMNVYREEQELLRRREQERLEAEAKKKAEDDALAQAQSAQESGDKEAAEAILSAPVHVEPVKVESFTPKTETKTSTRWSATITDPMFVLKAIEAAGKILAKAKTPDGIKTAELLRQAYTDAKYMVYDQVALNRQATATKDALKLGGVVFSSRKI